MAATDYRVIGLMSGSSLDGADIAYCHIHFNNGKWTYQIIQAETIDYPAKWKLRLKKLVLQNAITYLRTDVYFGHFLGELLNTFIDAHGIRSDIDFIASHGQTVFHQPENNVTSQIGDGAAIAAKTRLPVVCNFRTVDVAFSGQGAPIAPIADQYFFSGYKIFLNLGGISNLSFILPDKIIGYDVSPCNLVLNALAEKIGFDFDDRGEHAAKGLFDEKLFDELNQSWYYAKDYPKTLSGGFVSKVMMPVFKHYPITADDKLRTMCEHIAHQISRELNKINKSQNLNLSKADKMLVTGGGAFNDYLISRIAELSPLSIEIPDEQTIKFKEALLTALMGVLRMRNEVNCFSSVTGASQNNIGGAVYAGQVV